MTDEEKQELEELQNLAKAVRFNHDILDVQKVDMKIDPSWELENHALKITQLTLPHRFGMYKAASRNVKIKTKTELEEPSTEAISENSGEIWQDTSKRRSIFD